MKFVHLHVHSCYSLLEGASDIQRLLLRAKEHGMEALALTDTDALYGAVPFFKLARQVGIRPILGARITSPALPEGKPQEGAVCLARDRAGYANLCRIISDRKLRDDFDLAQELAQFQEGLYILTPSVPLLEKLAGRISSGGLFVELIRYPAHGDPSRVLRPPALFEPDPQSRRQGREASGSSDWPARTSLRQERAAESLRLPVVATNAVYFADAAQHPTHRVLTAIRCNRLLSDIKGDRSHLSASGGPGGCLAETAPVPIMAHPEAWLKSGEQMAALFRDRPEALRNALPIADECDVKLEADRPVFPTCSPAAAGELRPGETPATLRSPPAGGLRSTSFSRLWKLAFSGAARRYRPLTPVVMERLRRELDLIHKLGFAEYFLILHDIVRFAHSRNIPTVGRGSAADSLAAYCLGISAVDPLEHDLCFERFLNLQRPDCPDIDIDFCWRRRDEVLEYIFGKYGEGRVAMVANHNCYGARSAFRDVARVFGLPLEEVNRLSSVLPHHSVHSIREAMRQWPEMRDFPIDSEPYRTIVGIAEQIDRFPRHLSVHVGGVVIGDKPLTHYVPLERSAKGPIVCQYDKDGVEFVGLVKMDILAQRSLSIISDTLRWVEKNHGHRIKLDNLPPDDPATAGLLRRGGTLGCFQIESPGMRSLLQMMRARDRRDVIIGLSLIRPGPASSGMKDHFVRRRLGEEKPVYLHPSLRQTLADTYGVMLYQEDILRVAHAAAGFTLEEGDALRRTIKENPDPVRLGALHRRFVEGAVRNGGDPDQAEELWKLLNNFAAYSYCKAHATTYGYISYQAAYLKARYPAEFLAAVLANQAGFYETREYVEEARRLGVKILPPDVNRSEMNFHPAPAGTTGIRVGLMQVRELSARSIESILAAREQLPFASLADFVERASVCQSEAENLALCGALDCFGRLGGQGGTRPELLWKAQLLFRQSKALGERASSATAQRSELFSRLIKETARSGRVHKLLDLVPPLPDYTLAEKLSLEQELLGLTVTDHPLAAYESQLREVEHIPCHRLHLHVGKRVTVIGWLVTMRRAVTERGEYMKFVTLEDRQGLVEVVLFPDVYQKYGRLIGGYGPYIIEGKVKSHHGSLALTAESIEFLSGDSLGPRPRRAPAHQHTHAPSQTQHP